MAEKNKTKSARQAVIVEIGNDWLKIIQTEPQKGGVAVTRMHLEKFDTAEWAEYI